MTDFVWKISELTQQDGLIYSVKYWCQASDGQHTVATEGYWKFHGQYEFSNDLSEHQVSHWLDLDAIQNGRHLIKYRLQEQLDALRSATSTKPPWAVETFKVTI
jgi:hypothetical protein